MKIEIHINIENEIAHATMDMSDVVPGSVPEFIRVPLEPEALKRIVNHQGHTKESAGQMLKNIMWCIQARFFQQVQKKNG